MRIAISHHIWQPSTNTWLLPPGAFSAVCLDMSTTVAGTVEGQTAGPSIMAFHDEVDLPVGSIDLGMLRDLDGAVSRQSLRTLESKLSLNQDTLQDSSKRELLVSLLVSPRTGMPALRADKDRKKRLWLGGEMIGIV